MVSTILAVCLLATLLFYGNCALLESCAMLDLPGSVITKRDTKLKGHVRKSLANVSWVQCTLRCQRQPWCISINFQLAAAAAANTGRCELNDYGVQDEMTASQQGQFEGTPGFIYSQLRPAKYGCHSNICQNGGTCQLDCASTKVSCICPDGYQGNACEIDINECSSNPCQNGGTCADQVNGYTCTCAAGYTGLNCQTNINECSSNPCQNGGTCIDGVNGYTCTCAAGFTGLNCQTNINECSSNPCQNGGTCTDKVNGYNCTCVLGYEGPQCQTVSTCSLYWPNADITNLINANWSTSSTLSAITISYWIKVPSSYTDELFPFTYATVTENAAIHVKMKSNMDVDFLIMGDTKTMQTTFRRDNTWQHCCITWNRFNAGIVKFYKNGALTEFKDKMSENYGIAPGGKLIIGQRQGSYGANFDDKKLMVGHMTELNIWSRVFSSSEVKALSNTCHSGSKGDVVAWSDAQQGTLEGNVKKICPSTCT